MRSTLISRTKGRRLITHCTTEPAGAGLGRGLRCPGRSAQRTGESCVDDCAEPPRLGVMLDAEKKAGRLGPGQPKENGNENEPFSRAMDRPPFKSVAGARSRRESRQSRRVTASTKIEEAVV